MNKIYNDNEEGRSKLLEDLKNLPKINAPENFEYNLMTRIKNKSFEVKDDKTHGFSLAKFLAPSAAVVTVVLLFFIFYPKSQQINDLRMSQETKTIPPIVQQESVPAVSKDMAAVTSSSKKAALPQIIKEGNKPAQIQQQTTPQQFGANKATLLQNSRNAISLDEYISGDNSNERNMLQGSVVKGGAQVPEFDGFLVKQKTDPKTLKRYREVVDSLKKAQLKLDSLKKASNLP